MKSLTLGSMAVKLENRNPNRQSNKFVPKGMRKAISGFSKEARRNLLWRLQTLDYERLRSAFWKGYFITLTYQSDFYFENKDLNKVKKDLKKFFMKLDYLFKKLGIEYFAFWKMEFTKKGVPHYHLILFTEFHKDINQKSLIAIIPNFWVDVITNRTPVSSKVKENMYRVGTNVRTVELNKYQIIQVYISKEIGKDYQVDVKGYTGRFWGIEKRRNYQFFVKEDIKFISDSTFFKLRRALRMILRKKGYNSKLRSDNGLTLFYVMDMKQFERLLRFYEVEESEKVCL
jgi:hypothetical protein